MDFFKKLFGFPSQLQPGVPDSPENVYPRQPNQDDPRRFFSFEDDTPGIPHNFDNGGSNFNVFTDPLEMHRYFEQQMDNLLKSFGMPGFGSHFSNALEPPDSDISSQENYLPNSREYFLKTPDYSQTNEKVDKDVDGKLNVNDLDALLKNPQNNEQKIVPKNDYRLNRPSLFGGRFFNQSVSVKTIRNPDGSFETYRTITDNEGNQETTITKKQGDKEYTVIKKRDKEGREEVHENLINMTEDEKDLFEKRRNLPIQSNDDEYFDNSLFGKFFK